MLSRRELLAFLAVQALAQDARPFPPGTKPTSHGNINAGEGPVWVG